MTLKDVTNHGKAIVIAVAIVFGARAYLSEHDARLRADMQYKAAETTISALEQQQKTVAHTATVKVKALQKEAATIKTPVDAVKVLTSPGVAQIAKEPLSIAALPDAPDRVSVQALPLYRDLNACQQSTAELAACTQELDIQKQITGEKDSQITALKQKPGFFHRLFRAAKVIGCAGAGAAAGSLSKNPMGAAIGAAAGAGVCQAF